MAMTTWLRLAWLNRERIVAAARKLHWPIRVWAALAVVAALVGGLYVAFSTGYLMAPHSWPRIQYVLLAVNVIGFVVLYLAMNVWYARQDEVRDEMDQLRSQVDELRVAVHEHEHDIVEADGHAQVLPMVDLVATEDIPVQQAGPATTEFRAFRAAPVSGTVERQLGGRTFTFRDEAEA